MSDIPDHKLLQHLQCLQLLHLTDETVQLISDIDFDVPGAREELEEVLQSLLNTTDELFGPEYSAKILEYLAALCAKRGPDYFEKIDRIAAELDKWTTS